MILEDTQWKWYITPSFGPAGACVELDQTGSKTRRIALIVLNPSGQVGFAKWIPQDLGMTKPTGLAGPLVTYEADEKLVEVIESLWDPTKKRIVMPTGPLPDLKPRFRNL